MTQPLVSRHLPQVLAPVILLAALGAAPSAWAQATALAPTTASQTQKAPGIEQRTEHIVVEDAGSRIDELRVGGETRTITVQPKGGMPAYEIQPENSAQGSNTGSRGWKVFGF